MGSLFRPKYKAADGMYRESAVWWVKFYSNGRSVRESTNTTKETEARRHLRIREGDAAKGLPVSPKATRVKFAELAEDMVTDYKWKGKRSLRDLEMRLRLHLLPFFGRRRAASITTADINKYVAQRQEADATNGTINRELTAIKRAFNLGLQSGKVLHKPHIPMLTERNIRKGFFERDQFEAVRRHLPEPLQAILTFAYVTGWRIPSEVLRMEWRQVDLQALTVSLDPGTTKNGDGRVFYLTEELRICLEAQREYTHRVGRREGRFIPWVFHRNGKKIAGFRKAWATACYEAGLPCTVETETGGDGKVRVKSIKAQSIPHDFRRTAVRNLVRAGVPERVAMQMTGHKTRSVFERYNIVSEGDLKEAARKLNDFAMGKVSGKVAVALSGHVR